jgi:hypothetical protein
MKLAAERVDELISQGRIDPAKRQAYLGLSLSYPESFDDIVPTVRVVPEDEGPTTEDEVNRLTELRSSNGQPGGGRR